MGGAVPVGCTAISGGIGAVGAAIGMGTCAGDEDADQVATWARAEVLAAATRMESATYADLVVAWACAEVLAAAARMESAAYADLVAAWARAVLAAAAVRRLKAKM